MVMPELVSHTDLFRTIADGSIGQVELDRGGHWSANHNIWVDQRFGYFFDRLQKADQRYAEILGNAGLVIGKIFAHQVRDVADHVMWPQEVFGENGAERIIESYQYNPSVADPYSVLSKGLDSPAIPYSIVYSFELAQLSNQLRRGLSLRDSPSAQSGHLYLERLLSAYQYDEAKTSDLDFMHVADIAWVNISPDTPILFFAEPTEVYHDRARVALAQNPQIAQWANEIANLNGLGPWRNFFEFRLLIKDDSMVSEEEINTIRNVSRLLFSSVSDAVVPVSLEFRRLLLSSGNGAHPAKTAKNYPNFEDIRDKIGYKNTLYTNMLEEGTKTQVIPALISAFGKEFIAGFTEQQLIRGTILRVVAHEENHPYKRFRDTPLEELKASVHGIKALIESRRFNEEDINAILATEIGASLYGRFRMEQARANGDVSTQTSSEAYYKGDTILFNYLMDNGVFMLDGDNKVTGVNFDSFKRYIYQLADHLSDVQKGNTAEMIPQIYERYGSEQVWEQFKLTELAGN